MVGVVHRTVGGPLFIYALPTPLTGRTRNPNTLYFIRYYSVPPVDFDLRVLRYFRITENKPGNRTKVLPFLVSRGLTQAGIFEIIVMERGEREKKGNQIRTSPGGRLQEPPRNNHKPIER